MIALFITLHLHATDPFTAFMTRPVSIKVSEIEALRHLKGSCEVQTSRRTYFVEETCDAVQKLMGATK